MLVQGHPEPSKIQEEKKVRVTTAGVIQYNHLLSNLLFLNHFNHSRDTNGISLGRQRRI